MNNIGERTKEVIKFSTGKSILLMHVGLFIIFMMIYYYQMNNGYYFKDKKTVSMIDAFYYTATGSDYSPETKVGKITRAIHMISLTLLNMIILEKVAAGKPLFQADDFIMNDD